MKVAIITGQLQDSQYYDTFIPHYISEWEEVTDDQVDKIRKGLEVMSLNVPVAQRKWHYRLVFLPSSQKAMVAQALDAYEKHVKKEDERKEKMLIAQKKKELQATLKKKRSELKKTIKLIGNSANQDVINALHSELKSVEEDIKDATA